MKRHQGSNVPLQLCVVHLIQTMEEAQGLRPKLFLFPKSQEKYMGELQDIWLLEWFKF